MKFSKFINEKTVSVIITAFIFVLLASGSTFAYWGWQSASAQRSNVTFTTNEHYSCGVDGGGNITSNSITMMPTTCSNSSHAIVREITLTTALGNDVESVYLDLWLDINSIDASLTNTTNFKYSLTTSGTSCTSGVVAYGNFSDLAAGGKIDLINKLEFGEETKRYYLYVWLSSVETNVNTANSSFNISLGGQCTDEPQSEAFAVYSATDNSLRFYKSTTVPTEGSTYSGRVATNVYRGIEHNNYASASAVPWYGIRDSIQSVVVVDEITPISTGYWFWNFLNCNSLDLDSLNTSRVVNMASMFNAVGYNKSDVSVSGLEYFDTSHVINMAYMFYAFEYNTTGEVTYDLATWDVSNVIGMSYMFAHYGYNASVVHLMFLEQWSSLSNVKDMSNMFYQTAYMATDIWFGDIGNWDVSNVTNMRSMFYECGYTYDGFWTWEELGSWDVSNVTNFENMFFKAGYNATEFYVGDLGEWDTSSATTMSAMFNYTAYNAEEFDIGDIGTWDVSNVTTMYAMFSSAGYNAKNWSIGELDNWNPAKVTDMAYMFSGAGYNANLFDIGDIGNWYVGNVTTMTYMFSKAGYSAEGGFYIGGLDNWDTSSVTNLISMFDQAGYSAPSFDIGNLDNWNTMYVSNIAAMFRHAGFNSTTWNVGHLDNWDVAGITSLADMFRGAGAHATKFDIGDLQLWNVQAAQNMSYMFADAGRYNAEIFNVGELQYWITGNATNMAGMFYYAGYNADWELDLSGWDVSKVTNYGNFNSGVTAKVTAPTW